MEIPEFKSKGQLFAELTRLLGDGGELRPARDRDQIEADFWALFDAALAAQSGHLWALRDLADAAVKLTVGVGAWRK